MNLGIVLKWLEQLNILVKYKKRGSIKKINGEIVVRNTLIVLTFISLIITFLNFTYLTYDNLNTELINNVLVNYVNTWLMWINNILLYIFAFIYIVIGIKSKKEVLLKVSFSIFSILTSIISLVFIINIIAEMFGMF